MMIKYSICYFALLSNMHSFFAKQTNGPLKKFSKTLCKLRETKNVREQEMTRKFRSRVANNMMILNYNTKRFIFVYLPYIRYFYSFHLTLSPKMIKDWGKDPS